MIDTDTPDHDLRRCTIPLAPPYPSPSAIRLTNTVYMPSRLRGMKVSLLREAVILRPAQRRHIRSWQILHPEAAVSETAVDADQHSTQTIAQQLYLQSSPRRRTDTDRQWYIAEEVDLLVR
jgi:hypothetical protein